MCLAIPGKVLSIEAGSRPTMGRVSFGGVEKQVCLEWVPEVRVGDYVIVHVGFAISCVDEFSAAETLNLLEETAWETDEGHPRAEAGEPER
ncbi:MAG TPA: HypC/HybG/HupF family hydrogenase formation chaperone [Bacteroidota bacterium]|nr:HypC/HybG/HupF family hydrogenase formation chaperone [Bacteroidota bacterium]